MGFNSPYDHALVQKALELNSIIDPDSEPYRSKYLARQLLEPVLEEYKQENKESHEAVLHYLLGMNFAETEELSAGETHLTKAWEVLKKEEWKSSYICEVCAGLSQLALIWSERQEPNKSIFYLEEALKEYHLYMECSNVTNAKLEDIYTKLLFYSAQAQQLVGNVDLSANYCRKTLNRQLQQTYDPIDVSKNCISLSHYYLTQCNYSSADQCLSGAEKILYTCFVTSSIKYRSKSSDIDALPIIAELQKTRVVFYLSLLNGHEISTNVSNEAVFPVLSLECHEFLIPKNYEDARQYFLLLQNFANKALQYFVIDGFVTDFVKINQDISAAFRALINFEKDPDRILKMFKKRVNLYNFLPSINSAIYVDIVRQINYELAEIHGDISRIREFRRESPDKINKDLDSGIAHYTAFYKTLEVNGNIPKDPDNRVLVLRARLGIAHMLGKRSYSNFEEQLKTIVLSYNEFMFLLEAIKSPHNLLPEEVNVISEMCNLLPMKMEVIRKNIRS